MNDNTIYIETEDWQRHEFSYPEYIRDAATITWEDMVRESRESRASRIYGLYDSIYDELRNYTSTMNYNPTTRLSDYSYSTDYATVSNIDFSNIYYPNEEKILSFYYVNCDDA